MSSTIHRWSLILTAPQDVPEATAVVAERCSSLGLACDSRASSDSSFWSVELILSGAEAASESRLRGLTAGLERPGLGVSLLPLEQRRLPKRLLAMDMDSTLIEQEGIDELARQAGAYERVAAVTRLAMQGELDFDSSLRRRCGCLAGASASIVEEARRGLTLTPGAQRLISSAQAQGCRTALLSGGFVEMGAPIAQSLGFDDFCANRLEVREGVLTGRLEGPIVNAARKAQIVRRLAQRFGLRREEVVVIGDGANDLPMLREAGLGIAFDAKPAVQSAIGHSINVRRLDAALLLMGM